MITELQDFLDINIAPNIFDSFVLRFEGFVEKQLENQESSALEGINKTVELIISRHCHAEGSPSPATSLSDPLGLVKKIIKVRPG